MSEAGAGDIPLVAEPDEPAPAPAPRSNFFPLLHEGARSLLFRLPRWERVSAGPWIMVLLVLLDVAVSIGVGRLYIEGGATFNWRAAVAGWSGFVLTVWACYVLRPNPVPSADPRIAPSASHLLTLVMAQSLVLTVVYGVLYAALLRFGALDKAGNWGYWVAWLVPIAWGTVALLVVLMRTGERPLSRRVPAVYAVTMSCALTYFLAPSPSFWNEAVAAEPEEQEALRFTQETVEAQAPLLAAHLAALKPQRPGVADMYTITFAPYEGEEVFRRESRMVSEVMSKRFDAAGRNLQLLNHREHLDDMPWATAINLKRAIAGVAGAMDREEDVLFIHLTAHGARDGELAANFWPMDVVPVTPPDLKKWLDDAGIRYRVLSVSACFSGSWIKPLASDDTLVMTASDAEHTSYGCGKKSELTFFGRAMYDEQIRNTTLSFEQAHAAARKVIEKREIEAGKTDGYSNPQIKVGSRIGPYLEKMRGRLVPK